MSTATTLGPALHAALSPSVPAASPPWRWGRRRAREDAAWLAASQKPQRGKDEPAPHPPEQKSGRPLRDASPAREHTAGSPIRTRGRKARYLPAASILCTPAAHYEDDGASGEALCAASGLNDTPESQYHAPASQNPRTTPSLGCAASNRAIPPLVTSEHGHHPK
ncbi:hypothetical protein GGTG_11626 [Gaeumannomyces tritici R3-111a-1]|uniref:Uncharacterized protein n=1 Tax=Gaeumannomyces tritici (strain R3-111a-1) TaxID=644352 RepID=J3PDQ3_GAET3|nr:hypothetical protein GGTG_11626 [Gaeumannomyces tritici R3-111a-1]EJT70603.1 hypothetical protein GGTG_11626 [Gaeumannomyces tritici R3-111a-1]